MPRFLHMPSPLSQIKTDNGRRGNFAHFVDLNGIDITHYLSNILCFFSVFPQFRIYKSSTAEVAAGGDGCEFFRSVSRRVVVLVKGTGNGRTRKYHDRCTRGFEEPPK